MRVLLAILIALAGMTPASAADLKLLTAGAFKSVALELVSEFEKKTGHKVTVENDTAGAVARRVDGGEYVDVVVIPPAAMGPLLGSKLVESSAKQADPNGSSTTDARVVQVEIELDDPAGMPYVPGREARVTFLPDS